VNDSGSVTAGSGSCRGLSEQGGRSPFLQAAWYEALPAEFIKTRFLMLMSRCQLPLSAFSPDERPTESGLHGCIR